MENQNLGQNQISARWHEFRAGKKRLMLVFAFPFGVFLLALTFFVAVSGYNTLKKSKYIGQDIESRNTITVSGTGEVSARPDLGMISFSIVTEAVTVNEAMEENSGKMNRIIAFIEEQGVAEKDFKTANFNIYPRYEWRREGVYWPYPDGDRKLVGYTISQTLEVKMRDMEKIGVIIQGVTDLGVNQVGDLRFIIDDEDALTEQARESAIDKAKAKAEKLALQLGVKLARITNFSESGAPMPKYYSFSDEALGMGGGETVPEIAVGENEITVNVSITWEIQ